MITVSRALVQRHPLRGLLGHALLPAMFLASNLMLTTLACGRKGDPVPRPRAVPGPCIVRMASLRRLSVTLPERDNNGGRLAGIERVRVYYLPLGASQPSPAEVVAKGEVVLERGRPDLPGPGQTLQLDLGGFRRPRGWLVVVAVRVGEVVGVAGEIQIWFDPEL
jgi:hypothetical protein